MSPKHFSSSSLWHALFSAVTLIHLPRALSSIQRMDQPSQTPVHRTLDSIREGISFLWHPQRLPMLTLPTFGLNFTGDAVGGLLLVHAMQALPLSSKDAHTGLLLTAGSPRSFAGALFITSTPGKHPRGPPPPHDRTSTADVMNPAPTTGFPPAPRKISALTQMWVSARHFFAQLYNCERDRFNSSTSPCA